MIDHRSYAHNLHVLCSCEIKAYLPTLPVFPGVSKFFIKSPGDFGGYSWTFSLMTISQNAKISSHLQIFVLWGLAGMLKPEKKLMPEQDN